MRWLRKTDWVETEGRVWSTVAFQTKGLQGHTVTFSYEVDGHYCSGTFTTFTPYREGDTIKVKYDPANPDRNNLTDREHKLNWFYAVFFIAMGILAVYLFLQPKAN